MPAATELLFRDDAYLRECPAEIISVEGGMVQLDRTIFYPLGGGQPGDRGTEYKNRGLLGSGAWTLSYTLNLRWGNCARRSEPDVHCES